MASRARESGFWHGVGRQLANPRGATGALVGRLMRVANGRASTLAVEALDLEADNRVLDLGCGPGGAIRTISRRLPLGLVQGLDQSAVMLTQARRTNRAAVREGRVILTQGRFDALPYPDASFDRILACNVCYFWEDFPAVARELRRVLRPGGRIVVYVTDASSMRSWRFASPATHRLFDATSLREALADAWLGLLALRIEVVSPGFGARGLLATLSPSD